MTTNEDRIVWEADEEALYRTGRYSGSSKIAATFYAGALPATHSDADAQDAPVEGSTPTDAAADDTARRARYAEADSRFLRYQSSIHSAYDFDTEVPPLEMDDRAARAVMAVADSELAALRAERNEMAKHINDLAGDWMHEQDRTEAAEAELRALREGIRALADHCADVGANHGKRDDPLDRAFRSAHRAIDADLCDLLANKAATRLAEAGGSSE